MTSPVNIPLWLFIIILLFAAIMVLDRILMPSVRWYLRRKVNTIIGDVNNKLSIKLRSFQLTKKRVLVDRLVFDDQVIQAIKQYAKDNEMPAEVAQEKAYQYANEIAPKFNAYVYFKLGQWLAKKITRLIYRVRVGMYDNDKLKKIPRDSTVIFVMNHRSNMDYVVVSFLVGKRTVISYAVGEWARVWPLQTLIRSLGAFFVRRNSNNPLYRKVLERYVYFATQAGVCQAVYLEGGLSKDGALKKPKLGFLDYMLRGYDPSKDRDIVFVPVGLNYDRVVEDRSLERSLHKDLPKRSKWFVIKTGTKFFFKTVFMNRKKRWKKFGYAGVNFSEPISAKDYFATIKKPLHQLDKEQRFKKIEVFASELMQKVSDAIPILPVALLSDILLKQDNKIFDKNSLLDSYSMRIVDLKNKGAPINISPEAYEGVMGKALSILLGRNLIQENSEGIHIVKKNKNILTYYANSIGHWQ